jgi:hypothetical protein
MKVNDVFLLRMYDVALQQYNIYDNFESGTWFQAHLHELHHDTPSPLSQVGSEGGACLPKSLHQRGACRRKLKQNLTPTRVGLSSEAIFLSSDDISGTRGLPSLSPEPENLKTSAFTETLVT